jgi:hypothetical protein
MTSTAGWTAEELLELDKRVKRTVDTEVERVMFEVTRELLPVAMKAAHDSNIVRAANPVQNARAIAREFIVQMEYAEKFYKTIRDEAIQHHNRYRAHLAACSDISCTASAKVPS